MPRLFSDVLRELGRAQTHDDLTDRLGECVQAVKDTGKQATLTLNIKIKPNGEDSVIIADEIKTRIPEANRGDTVFFTTADGGLHRADPRQAEMPLRTVEGAAS